VNDADRPPQDPQPDVTPDPYLEWDGAYVLGALSPSDRREFEGHLASCPRCRAAVAEISGLPGLLAQLTPEEVADLGAAVPPPPAAEAGAGVVPQLVRLDRQRRRLARALVAVAAALLLLAGVVGVAAVRGSFDLGRPSASAPFRVAFTPVVATGITAVVDVVPEASGTELRVECQYAGDSAGPSYAGHEYAIVVTDTSGHSTQVKTWTARADHKMTPTGTSSLPVSKIRTVEIRPVNSSQALLRAALR
jgi:anti-sigma factor RsiW